MDLWNIINKIKEIKMKFNLIRFCYTPFEGISSESVN
jgi:hypothetical protein